MWTWLDKLGPNRSLIDAWYAIQHLKDCADDADGKDTAKGRKWFDKHRTILLEDAKGIGRPIDAIRHLSNSGRGGAILGSELVFFRKNRARTDHQAARDAGCPIGSDCVEPANRIVVQQGMKRWGQALGTARRTGRPDVPFPAEIGTLR